MKVPATYREMSESENDSHSDEPVYVTGVAHELAQQDAANERAQLSATVADLGATVHALAGDTKSTLASILAAIKPGPANPVPPTVPSAFQNEGGGSGLFGHGAPGIMGFGQDNAFAYPGHSAASGGAAAGGGGLMPGAVPAVLGDPHVGFGPWGASGGAISASQRRCDKAYADARAAAWTDTAGRCWWATGGLYQPTLSKRALASVLLDSVEMTDSVTVARKGVPATPHIAAGARGRVDELGRAFHDLLMLLEQHSRDHYDAINRPRTRGIVEALLAKDMKTWVRDVQRFAEDVGRANFYPPDTLLPPAPLPRFPAFRSYIAVGGLINAAHSGGATDAASATRGGGAGGGSARTKVCRQFTRTGSCRFGAKCAFRHAKPDGGGAAGGGNGKGGGGGSGSSGGGSTTASPPPKKARTNPAGGSGNTDKGKSKKPDADADGDNDDEE